MNILEKPFDQEFNYPYLFILLLGSVFFVPFLGYFHLFDWDEINFAESAREMLVTGNYFQVTINFVPFWEKPPLFFWLQALSMQVFGVNEFAARFPNVLCGLATLMILYKLGKQMFDHRFGMLWAMLYLGALLPHLYFKSGIIDPVFNLFIFLSIWQLILVIETGNRRSMHAFLSGIFVGLAILTKGPVGLLIVLLTFLVYWASEGFKGVAKWTHVLLLALGAFIVSSLWFGPETLKNGPWFIVEFIEYQIRLLTTPDAGHQQPFYYHFVVVLIGCFPFSVFAIKRLIVIKRDPNAVFQMDRWMRYLFWVVMILFTIVKTKIVHYSSMAYLPLSFLAVLYLHECLLERKRPVRWILYFNMIVGVILSLAVCAVAVLLIKKDWLLALVDHPSLGVEVPMFGFEYFIGLFYLAMTVLVFIQIIRNSILKGLMLHTLALGITLFLSSFFLVPKIEAYSQRPAIAFYESLVGKNVYVLPLFRTYGHYFYARITPEQSTAGHERIWFLEGDIDKPVYFIEYKRRAKALHELEDLEHLYDKGDFSFFLRSPDL